MLTERAKKQKQVVSAINVRRFACIALMLPFLMLTSAAALRIDPLRLLRFFSISSVGCMPLAYSICPHVRARGY